MRVAAAVVCVLAFASLGLTCGGGGPPPVTPTCEPGVGGSVTSVEIGTLVGDEFRPFVDGGVADLVFGGQGASMIVAHLRLRGTGLPACVAQRTVLETLDGMTIADERAGLPTDPAGDGVWVTGYMYLVYEWERGVQVRLRATAGGVERSVVVWAGFESTVDAGVDAPTDAPPPVDAGVDAP